MMFNLKQYGGNTAIIDENARIYSYTMLMSECDHLAKEIKQGRCLVFCLCQNCVGSLVGYLSMINNRIVPLLLDAHLNREMLDSLIQAYKPDYLWLPAEVSYEFKYKQVYKALDYVLVKTPYTKAFDLFDNLALLLTTSGSTGSPKLVRQSYENIRANTESIVSYLDLDSSERPITTLPMSYTYGLSIINSHLWVGASLVLTQKSLANREFWQQFKEFKVTSFGGVPYIYEMLEKLRFFNMDLPSLRTMTQAGGKLSPELHKKFAEYAKATGKHFVVMYGQTEATARIAYLPPQKSLEKYGSMGIAIPGGKLSLIDIDGNEVDQPDVTGELVYKGANVTLGYAETGTDLNKGDEREGKLFTGDMAKRDSDGYYYIVGRKKRFLKIFGSRTNLDEIERIIKARFLDIDCACGGVDDKLWVFITDGNMKREVLKYLIEKTGFNHTAFEVKTIDEIPKNEAGKTLYVELDKHYK